MRVKNASHFRLMRESDGIFYVIKRIVMSTFVNMNGEGDDWHVDVGK